jgi:hypothetical protein
MIVVALTMAENIGKAIIKREHEHFVQETIDNSDYIPFVKITIEGVIDYLMTEGATEKEITTVASTLKAHGKKLFVTYWLKGVEDGEDEGEEESEAEQCFESIFENENESEDEYEEQEKKIMAILDTEKLDVTKNTLKTYLKYLKKHVELPCQLTGIEDFDWEERYVFGFGSKKEYEELKKTQPSYKDNFSLINFIDDIDDECDGIFVNVQRVSDKKKFTLPLADLKSTDRKSENYQLLEDYSVWFVNNR